MLVGDLVSSNSDVPSDIEDNEEDKSIPILQCIATHAQVDVVTEENVSQYTIFDVVMPMIGKSVQFPQNQELKNLYDKYMKEDEITIAMFESKSMESGCAHGAYRHIGKH